jgi:hypothetical protein
MKAFLKNIHSSECSYATTLHNLFYLKVHKCLMAMWHPFREVLRIRDNPQAKSGLLTCLLWKVGMDLIKG